VGGVLACEASLIDEKSLTAKMFSPAGLLDVLLIGELTHLEHL
jgi:hypothetical protein